MRQGGKASKHQPSGNEILDVVLAELGNAQSAVVFAMYAQTLASRSTRLNRTTERATLARLGRIAKSLRSALEAIGQLADGERRSLLLRSSSMRYTTELGKTVVRAPPRDEQELILLWAEKVADAAERTVWLRSNPRHRPADRDLSNFVAALGSAWLAAYGRRPGSSDRSPFVRVAGRIAHSVNPSWSPSVSTIRRALRAVNWSEVGNKYLEF